MHYIFNHSWIVEVLIVGITWCDIGNGSGVAGYLW